MSEERLRGRGEKRQRLRERERDSGKRSARQTKFPTFSFYDFVLGFVWVFFQ